MLAHLSVFAFDPACPCIDAASQLDEADTLTLSGFRPSQEYGSNVCRAWDELEYPGCQEPCGNECVYANDGECDDGGEGSSYSDCTLGSDCSDCGPRPELPVPDFCPQQWCYVNGTLCKISNLTYRETQNFPKVKGLFYSYDTCSPATDYDPFGRFLNANYGHGMTLKAAVPTSSYPLHYKAVEGAPVSEYEGPYEDDSWPWVGAYVDYVHALAARTPFSVQLTFVSGGARSGGIINDSPWTAAIIDVATGIADFAASDFWVTTERANIVSFSVPIRQDKVYLFVPRPAVVETDFLTASLKIFEPFRWDLWVTILGVVVAMSLIEMWLQRGPRRDGEWSEEAPPARGSRCSRVAWWLRVWLQSFVQAVMHMTVGLPGTKGDRPGETTLWLGWSILLFLLVNAYIANLAANLISFETNTYIDSMQAAVDASLRICLNQNLENETIIAYPEAASFLEPIPGSIAVDAEELRGFYAEKGCGAMVMSINEVQRDQGIARVMCCLNLFAAVQVLSIPLAFPVRPSLVGPLSYWVQNMSRTDPLESFDELRYLRCSDVAAVSGALQCADSTAQFHFLPLTDQFGVEYTTANQLRALANLLEQSSDGAAAEAPAAPPAQQNTVALLGRRLMAERSSNGAAAKAPGARPTVAPRNRRRLPGAAGGAGGAAAVVSTGSSSGSADSHLWTDVGAVNQGLAQLTVDNFGMGWLCWAVAAAFAIGISLSQSGTGLRHGLRMSCRRSCPKEVEPVEPPRPTSFASTSVGDFEVPTPRTTRGSTLDERRV